MSAHGAFESAPPARLPETGAPARISTDDAAALNRHTWDSIRRQRDEGLIAKNNDVAADIVAGKTARSPEQLTLLDDVGDLDAWFSAAHRALEPGGVLLLTGGHPLSGYCGDVQRGETY